MMFFKSLLNTLTITFDPENFVKYLPKMGIGMLTIFVIIAVIIIVTAILGKASSGKDKK